MDELESREIKRLCYILKFSVDVAVLLSEVIVVILFLYVAVPIVCGGKCFVLQCGSLCHFQPFPVIILKGGEILLVPNMLIYSIIQ